MKSQQWKQIFLDDRKIPKIFRANQKGTYIHVLNVYRDHKRKQQFNKRRKALYSNRGFAWFTHIFICGLLRCSEIGVEAS